MEAQTEVLVLRGCRAAGKPREYPCRGARQHPTLEHSSQTGQQRQQQQRQPGLPAGFLAWMDQLKDIDQTQSGYEEHKPDFVNHRLGGKQGSQDQHSVFALPVFKKEDNHQSDDQPQQAGAVVVHHHRHVKSIPIREGKGKRTAAFDCPGLGERQFQAAVCCQAGANHGNPF